VSKAISLSALVHSPIMPSGKCAVFHLEGAWPVECDLESSREGLGIERMSRDVDSVTAGAALNTALDCSPHFAAGPLLAVLSSAARKPFASLGLKAVQPPSASAGFPTHTKPCRSCSEWSTGFFFSPL
jgi:hypothetical protein